MKRTIARVQGQRACLLAQDGLVLSMTLRGLRRAGLLPLLGDKDAGLADLRPPSAPGLGSFRVATRTLAAQGWIAQLAEPTPVASSSHWTTGGRAAFPFFGDYLAVGDYLACFDSPDADSWCRPWPNCASSKWSTLLRRAEMGWTVCDQLPCAVTAAHLNGALAVPALLHTNPPSHVQATLHDVLGWDHDSDGIYRASLGLAGSYLPMLSKLHRFYNGSAVVNPDTAPGRDEEHVNRALNIRASAAAQKRYFADANDILSPIFNTLPLSEQPPFVADVGCGDGSWLVAIDRFVREHTIRGMYLDRFPLRLIGVDANDAALDQAMRRLGQATNDFLVLQGDVTDPDNIAHALREHGIQFDQGLHIRSFVDHDRRIRDRHMTSTHSRFSSGAYMDDQGSPLPASTVERDLVAHLRRWEPFCRRHGLVVLEAHTTHPRTTRSNLGYSHNLAFDAYHGYSHQYPVEHMAWLNCCRRAGFESNWFNSRRYPVGRPFVSASLTHFTKSKQLPSPNKCSPYFERHAWIPDSELSREDGAKLHDLLFEDGDTGKPRFWCAPACAWLVSRAIEVVETRLNSGGRDQVVILDYGAGTGLATIELLKAMEAQGIAQRCRDADLAVEIHLVDFPHSWYAQGFDLLSSNNVTRFHSLRLPNGDFDSLSKMVGERSADIVMANMVLHLVRPSGIRRLARDIQEVLTPTGKFIWTAPDLGPPRDGSVLFHDPNRMMRKKWLDILHNSSSPSPGGIDKLSARNLLTQTSIMRANRRILRQPNSFEEVVRALEGALRGRAWRRFFEIEQRDVVNTMMVPSNHSEYLSECEDCDKRVQLVEYLMEMVFEDLSDNPARTEAGLMIDWTLGEFYV